MLRRLFKPAVELAQAAVELFARRVQAAAEEESDQGEPGAQRLHVHLGFLAVNEPLPEKTQQKLRHRDAQHPEHTTIPSAEAAEMHVPAVFRRHPAPISPPIWGFVRAGGPCEALHRGSSSGVSAVQECTPLNHSRYSVPPHPITTINYTKTSEREYYN